MHYYQFHIGDYRAGTIHLTQIERWVYRDLLDCLYDTEKPLPTDFDKVCMMVGARSEEHREAVKIVLLQKFTETVDGFINNRFLQELEKYQSKAERAINANKKRWGHDNVVKLDVISDAVQIATNNQEPITNNHKPIKRVKEIALPDGVLESVWQDFVSQRKAKKSAITQTALKGIEREANKANISLNDALQEICARGWTGFKAEWMTKTADNNLSFAERDELAKRKRWEEMTGRKWPTDDQQMIDVTPSFLELGQ